MRRLEKSRYANNFVLKGGLFLYALTEFDSRVTVDVDFMLRRIPNTPEKLREVIDEIINSDNTNDFITFEIKNVSPISVNKEYPGIHADIVARIKNTRTPFGIDFGIGDIIVPESKKRKIPTQLPDFSSPVVQTYSVETTVAEKLDAILNLMEFSSRMKDYYDIWYLANKFDFDGKLLTEAMKKTFDNRARTFELSNFKQVIAFDRDDAMQKKWSAFCKKISTETNFAVVLKTIDTFLSEPFSATITGTSFDKTWDNATQRWK